MLRDLFPRVHEQYEQSRCGPELEAFADWLSRQGHLRHPLDASSLSGFRHPRCMR